tara:strand:- start:230 stop:664 length:435 start_codon:yes stop_codon:yes gene_type:complete
MKNSEIKRLISDGWVQVLFTMTVQGNDGKKVDEALRSQLNEMEKLGKIVESKISKPELIEKSKSWYSQFSEIEIMLDNPDKIFDILLDYMVNSVEIIAPDNLNINSQTYQDRLNDLAIKFRETEKAVLYLSARNKILERENKSN